MAKLNEGDVIEGIFAIACCLYFAEGTISKTKLNKIRSELEPSMFRSGRVKKEIQTTSVNNDVIVSSLEIRLKPESVTGAYGKDFSLLLSKGSDIGNIDKKIDTLIQSVTSSQFIQKLKSARDTYINNKIPEILNFTAIADGIAGESSGGDIKGDVTVQLTVSDKTGKIKKDGPFEASFSLKSNSVTVANLSPYNGMLAIAKYFGVSYKSPEKYESILNRKAITQTEKDAVNQLLPKMFDELGEMLERKTDASFSDKAFDYLYGHVHGSDAAHLVDIQDRKVKEISAEQIKSLKKAVKLIAKRDKNYIRFCSAKSPDSILFNLRLKIRTEANERKFYVELGNMIH